MRNLTLPAWLAYIQQLHPTTMDLSLARVKQVAETLAVTSFNYPVVVVTGTNGKGSCIAFLEKLYLAGHYRVGTYTSPYLLDYREQVRVNGQMCSEKQWCEAFAKVNKARENITLTIFEFTTLAALLMLKSANLDLVILEVGMGGLTDAVNVVDNNIAVITNVSLEHQAWLGKTVEAIATQKAGIFRANQTAIYGTTDVPVSVRRHAALLNCQLFCRQEDFDEEDTGSDWHWVFKGAQYFQHLPYSKLDRDNAVIALMIVKLLEATMSISKPEIDEAIRTADLPGRFQVVENKVTTIFDVAHNPHACGNLARKVRQLCEKRPLHIVVGMLKDKDIESCLDSFIFMAHSWHVATLPSERGADGQRLKNYLLSRGISEVYAYDNVDEAYQRCREAAAPESIVLVFGSFLTVAAAMQSSRVQ